MITCREVTELLTEYLEGEMSASRRLNFKLHFMICPSCRRHLYKMQQMINSLGGVPCESEVPEDVLEHLVGLIGQ